MTPYLDDGDVVLHLGDCVEVMAAMEPESVDAVVCDPPYGLEFMGKEWDGLWDKRTTGQQGRIDGAGGMDTWGRRPSYQAGAAAQEWHQAWAAEALRVLRPGGHLLAFGGTRTFHRLTCAIEDAGFEVRDCLSWIYGSGFPKSLDVSKAIDKAAGAEREVVGRKAVSCGTGEAFGKSAGNAGQGAGTVVDLTAPATPEAAAWQGWGTALKPAWEPIVVARKPLAGTVAANVLRHGTGALNVDGCRVGMSDEDRAVVDSRSGRMDPSKAAEFLGGLENGRIGDRFTSSPAGRWPANVVLSHTPECREVGTRKVKSPGTGSGAPSSTSGVAYGTGMGATFPGKRPSAEHYGTDGTEMIVAFECHPECPVRRLDEEVGERTSNSGTPFNRRDVGYHGGCEPTVANGYYGDTGGVSRFFYTAKASSAERDGATHPTVKPLALMRWLVRLVTPPGGVVLDPFAGSGTTGLACRAEGFACVLIEREREYVEMAAHRLRQLSLFGGAA